MEYKVKFTLIKSVNLNQTATFNRLKMRAIFGMKWLIILKTNITSDEKKQKLFWNPILTLEDTQKAPLFFFEYSLSVLIIKDHVGAKLYNNENENCPISINKITFDIPKCEHLSLAPGMWNATSHVSPFNSPTVKNSADFHIYIKCVI